MDIKIQNTPEQVELVKAMGSKNREEAYEAQVTLAGFVGPVVSQVINNAPTISNLFSSFTFNPDDNPTIPLETYFDIFDEDYIKVYSQSVAGGLPSNHIQPTSAELKFATYDLESAFSFDRKYAERSRLDVVGKTFTRMAQEFLLKQERTSANLIMSAAAGASTGSAAFTAQNRHIFRTAQANRFLLDDLNKLFTKAKRANSSWAGGTPSGARRGITDLLVSPEVTEQIRAMAYNPINTLAPNGSAVGATSQPIALTDEDRRSIFTQAGLTEFFGVSIMEVLEMGVGKRFNEIFGAVAGSTDYLNHGSTSASGVFAEASEELILAIDRSRDTFMKAVAVDPDLNSSVEIMPDDQFVSRQKKIGFWGNVHEGRVVIDTRAIFGLIM